MLKILKKLPMNLIKSCPLLFILILSSCANIVIHDQVWCGDKGPLGATCFHTLSEETLDIQKEEWDAIETGPNNRFGKICTDPSNFGDWKAVILNLCKVSKRCHFDVKNKVLQFNENVDNLRNEIMLIRSSNQ